MEARRDFQMPDFSSCDWGKGNQREGHCRYTQIPEHHLWVPSARDQGRPPRPVTTGQLRRPRPSTHGGRSQRCYRSGGMPWPVRLLATIPASSRSERINPPHGLPDGHTGSGRSPGRRRSAPSAPARPGHAPAAGRIGQTRPGRRYALRQRVEAPGPRTRRRRVAARRELSGAWPGA